MEQSADPVAISFPIVKEKLDSWSPHLYICVKNNALTKRSIA